MSYEDTNGATSMLPANGLEWMRAGGGVWHGRGADEPGRTRGFQLRIAPVTCSHWRSEFSAHRKVPLWQHNCSGES